MSREDGRLFRFAWLGVVFFLCAGACFSGQAPDDSGGAGRRVRYDPLPSSFAALDRYDKIALQPYRDKYDLMPYHEKARVYAQMFEFMNDRKPNFSPAVLDRIKQSEEISSARSSLKAREFMYKAAPKPREKVPETPPDPNAAILAKIPMPWKAPEAEEEEMEEALPPPGEESYRMESLRYGGWNVRRDPGERKAP